jgi:septal ring factor EnvC (AmiA/AmiB activator)
VNGDEYISWGGNDQNGAEGWKQVMKPKGRPKKEDAMSNAEKQKAYRDRQRTMQYQMLVNPPIDKQLEAEATLNKKLAQSTAEQNTRLVKEKAILKTEFDALANKLAMTERALLSSQAEVKRLYEEIAELNREIVKLSKKPKKGFL